MNALLTVLLTAASLAACAPAPPRPVSELPRAASASFGQPAQVGALVVTPLRLIEDSRCPMNARCVWAGRLVIRARIAGPAWSENASLTLGKEHRSHGLGLALVSALPERAGGNEVPQSAYAFGFEPR